MDDAVEAMDRISELPHFIIHQIMSYLTTKEVARTSVLSNKWNQLRIAFPILVFDQNFFPGGIMDYKSFHARKPNEKFCETVRKFLEFVDFSLLRFCELKFCIQRLRLFLVLLDVKETAPMVDKWIGLAVENGVRVLEVVNTARRQAMYTLPRTIFNANLITTLELDSCRLEQPSESLRLHSLKRLMLTKVCLDERVIQKLTSECPVLEHLCFSCCWGFKSLRVFKSFKLKIMEIHISDEMEIVEIAVPSLQQLTLRFPLEKKPHIVVARSPHLKKLYLSHVSFASEEFNQLISKFPLLEDLSVVHCCLPGRIKISSNQLKNLLLSYSINLKAIDVDTPNLLSFTYRMNPIPTTTLMNVPCLWNISFYCQGDLDTTWYLELKKFLGVSNQIENLRLTFLSSKVVSNLDKHIECSSSLALQVRNLELFASLPLSDYETLLDGVFWICYPRTLRVPVVYEENHNFVEDRDVNCCNSRHIKCWRHYLKDVKTSKFLESDRAPFFGVDGWTMRNREVSEFYFDWCVPVLNEK